MAKDSNYLNESAPHLQDYFARQRLAKLGFVSSFEDLEADDAEAFLLIDAEVEALKARMLKKGK